MPSTNIDDAPSVGDAGRSSAPRGSYFWGDLFVGAENIRHDPRPERLGD
jgi:hypothetical protein